MELKNNIGLCEGVIKKGLGKGSIWRRVCGISCIIIGLSILLYPQIEKMALDSKQKKLIAAFEQVGKMNNSLETASIEAMPNDDKLASLKGVRGVIRIPKIDAALPIFEGASTTSLSQGIGMIEPEKEFGVHNVGLAGHRAIAYGKQFNRLNELKPNDEIEVNTKTNSYKFIVNQTFVVDRTEIGVLSDKSEPYLTLITCTPIGEENPTNRLIVQARLKQITKITQ